MSIPWGCATGGTGNNRLFVSNNEAPVRVNVLDTTDPANPFKVQDVFGLSYGIGIGASQNFIAILDYSQPTKIRNANTLALVATLDNAYSNTTKFMGSSFSDDESMYAQHSGSYQTVLFRTSDWSVIRSYNNISGTGPTAFSPDGSSLYIYPDNLSTVYQVSTTSQVVLNSAALGTSAYRNELAVSPSGDVYVAVGSSHNQIGRYSPSLTAMAQTGALSGTVYSIACSPDGSTVYVHTSSLGYALNATTLATKFTYSAGYMDVAVSGSGAAVYSVDSQSLLYVCT
jgi:sugar lactone lactonase YvrE